MKKKPETYYQHLEITIKTLTRTVKLKKEILLTFSFICCMIIFRVSEYE